MLSYIFGKGDKYENATSSVTGKWDSNTKMSPSKLAKGDVFSDNVTLSSY